MTSKVKTDPRFRLSRPSYLLTSVLGAVIGLIEAILDPKSQCTATKI